MIGKQATDRAGNPGESGLKQYNMFYFGAFCVIITETLRNTNYEPKEGCTMKMMERIISSILLCAMLVSVFPVRAFAEEENAGAAPLETEEQAAASETDNLRFAHGVYTSEPDYDSEELYLAYAEKLFYGSDRSVFGSAAGETLTGDEKILYDAVVPFIRQIANGERTSATISIGQEAVIDGVTYAVDREAVFTGTDFTTEMLGHVVDALLADLPYEMYWYEKTTGCAMSYIVGSRLIQVILYFTVADNYASGEFVANPAKTGVAAAAAANARNIVNAYASASDYDKLAGYRDEICALVSYDHAAADGGYFDTDIDPWQLISVFDGNSSTNVVCEGYSKAFMYLCDQTSFLGNVSCYTVTGALNGGAHMWNIADMNGKHYLVDVTNSDSGTAGEIGGLFLAGGQGSAAEGYRVAGLSFVYSSDTLGIWGTGTDSILTLESEDFASDGTNELTGICGDNLTWTLDNEGTLTISGTGAMWDFIIAEEEGSITYSTPWCSSITSVVIEPGVTSIGGAAFCEPGLTDIEIPNSVTSIGRWAFSGCDNLTTINIPDSVTSIGEAAFYDCDSLTYVKIPDRVTSIGKNAFRMCDELTSVVLGSGVTDIGESAFFYCQKLTKINIPNSVTSIGTYAFGACAMSSIVIPDSVTSIGESVFSGCSNLEHVVIGSGLTSITEGLFSSTGITSIELPDGIISIGDGAFDSCFNLRSIEIPDGVTSIGPRTFNSCISLTSIKIPDSVTEIGEDAFTSCDALTDIYITDPSAWCRISFGSLYANPMYRNEGPCLHILDASGNEVTDVVLDDSVTTIPDCTFMGSNLTSIVIPGSVTSVGFRAFRECANLTNATLGPGLISIGAEMFCGCINLSNVEIPNTVTGIGNWAFSSCDSLTSMIIPKNVKSIGVGAFGGCNSLTEIYFAGDAPEMIENPFDGMLTTCYYPAGNDTWTEDFMQRYSFNVTWKQWTPQGNTEVLVGSVLLIQNENGTYTATPEVTGGTGSYAFTYWLFNTRGEIVDLHANTYDTSWTFDAPAAPGQYLVRAYATDFTSGMYEDSAWVQMGQLEDVKVRYVHLSSRDGQMTATPEVTGGSGSKAFTYWMFNPRGEIVDMHANTYDTSWTFETPAEPGMYLVRAYATDFVSGEYADTAWFHVGSGSEVTVSFLTLRKNADGSITATPQVSGGSGSYAFTYWMFNTSGEIVQMNANTYDTSWTFRVPDNKQYLIRAYATDFITGEYNDTAWFVKDQLKTSD